MPFAGFDDFDDCLQTMTEEEGHDEESAENICGALQAEEKSDAGNVEQLRQALEDGAGLIADVGVDLVSGVDVPAVDSKWTMLKADSDGHDYRVNSPVLLSKADDNEKRISYAAAMIPRELDKEGDVVATPTVEKAAHDFLAQDGGVDTDHSLIDGDGEVVESWVLKDERTFDLPDGGTETYGAGTWMVGIKWAAEPWERIKSGELTGLSIYGMAEHVQLDKAACGCNATAKQLDIPLANESVVHLVYESRTAAEKASEEIDLGGDVHEHEFDGMAVWMPGESHEAFVDRYMELSDDADEDTVEQSATGDNDKGEVEESKGMGDTQSTDDTNEGGDDVTIDEVAASVDDLAETVSTLKETVETEKQDARELADGLGDEFDMPGGDVMDILQAAADVDTDAAIDAIATADKADDEDEDDDEEEMEESAEKRADDAHVEKGSNGTTTAAKGVEDDDEPATGDLSWDTAKAEYGGD